MSDLLIRKSELSDIPAITSIYAQHVASGTASFETDAPNREEIGRRRDRVLRSSLPYLVAERNGAVAGFAYAAPYRPRPAYRFTIEDSVYVHPWHLRKGAGHALLAELIRQCETGPWRQMIAVIGDSANTGSIRLHESLGFRNVGVFQSVGWKFDRWLDTVLMQRALGSGDRKPAT
jgi:phosphinothricin acetyltransferase